MVKAAKEALDRVECNQYSPTKGRPRLLKALSDAYSPYFNRTLDPATEIVVTTGANEGEWSWIWILEGVEWCLEWIGG